MRSQRVAMTLCRVSQKHGSVLDGPQREDPRISQEGCPQERICLLFFLPPTPRPIGPGLWGLEQSVVGNYYVGVGDYLLCFCRLADVRTNWGNSCYSADNTDVKSQREPKRMRCDPLCLPACGFTVS